MARYRLGAIAEPSRADPLGGPVERDLLQPDAVGGELGARPDHDPVLCRVLGEDVERLPSTYADAAALPDREAVVAVVPAEHPALRVDDLAGRGGQAAPARRVRRWGPPRGPRPGPGESTIGRGAGAGGRPPCRRMKAFLPLPARKQRSWLSRLSATGSPASRASSRTAGLWRPPSGKERRSSCGARSRASM